MTFPKKTESQPTESASLAREVHIDEVWFSSPNATVYIINQVGLRSATSTYDVAVVNIQDDRCYSKPIDQFLAYTETGPRYQKIEAPEFDPFGNNELHQHVWAKIVEKLHKLNGQFRCFSLHLPLYKQRYYYILLRLVMEVWIAHGQEVPQLWQQQAQILDAASAGGTVSTAGTPAGPA